LLTLAAGVLGLTLTAPARAADHGHRDHHGRWEHRDWRGYSRPWRHVPRTSVYVAPSYYVPPVGVYSVPSYSYYPYTGYLYAPGCYYRGW
jgi:hypothetical protein